jgi:hypothetical protein
MPPHPELQQLRPGSAPVTPHRQDPRRRRLPVGDPVRQPSGRRRRRRKPPGHALTGRHEVAATPIRWVSHQPIVRQAPQAEEQCGLDCPPDDNATSRRLPAGAAQATHWLRRRFAPLRGCRREEQRPCEKAAQPYPSASRVAMRRPRRRSRSPSMDRCFRGVDKPALWVQDRPGRVGQLERGEAAGDAGCDRLAVWGEPLGARAICRRRHAGRAAWVGGGLLGAVCITAAKGRRLLGGVV